MSTVKQAVSRRGFLKGAAALSTLAATGGAVPVAAATINSPRYALKPYKIGLMAKVLHEVWEAQVNPFKEVFARMGGEVHYNSPKIEDVARQREIFEGFLAEGVDAICFAASDDVFTDLVEEAYKKRIPVITWTGEAPTSGRLLYIGTDDYNFGRKGAETIVEHLGGKGKVAIMQGSATAPNAVQRGNGAEEVFEEAGMEVVTRDFDKEDVDVCMAHVEQILVAYPDLDAFMSIYGYHIETIGNVLHAAGKAGEIAIGGLDPFGKAWDYIRDGTCFGAWSNPMPNNGIFTAIWLWNYLTFGPDYAYKLVGVDQSLPLDERKVPVIDIYVTADNVDPYLEYMDRLWKGEWGPQAEPFPPGIVTGGFLRESS